MSHVVFFILFCFSVCIYGQVDSTKFNELDSLACVLQDSYLHEDYIACNEIANKVLEEYSCELKTHPYVSHIVKIIVSAKCSVSKWNDIPDIVDQWWSEVKDQKNPDNAEEYFTLPWMKCIALDAMGKKDAARRIYKWMLEEYKLTFAENHTFAQFLERLGNSIENTDHTAIRKSISKNLNEMGMLNLLLHNPYPDTWSKYHKGIRDLLANYYYDISSPEDEIEWSHDIAWQISCYINGCKDLPDREGELYDNILVYKDFLNYHNSRNNKLKKTWKDVESSLGDEEAAIEISMFPSEILIVKKGMSNPVSVEIDSVLLDRISEMSSNDPIKISEMYSPNGVLDSLWNLMEPHLLGINRIFISGSHVFTHINYSVIPFQGVLSGDRYNIVQLTTTADVETAKEYIQVREFKNACVLGAVDYDCTNNIETTLKTDSANWTLYRCIPDTLRSSFCHLPGSLKEIECIDSIMLVHGIQHAILRGQSASERAVKDLSGQRIDILHLSTHGFMLGRLINDRTNSTMQRSDSVSFYQTIPYQSGLLMAGSNKTWLGNNTASNNDDGILTSKEISEMSLRNVKLAVLSACDTGLGNTNNAIGISYGVHNAMKSAGVYQCLACLWKVSDYATYKFYETFRPVQMKTAVNFS